MPKIIENLEEKLLCEARKQLLETGYSAMTIRSVAAGCGVGVGTVYNYFPSKDALLAASMLEDWQGCVAAVHGVSGSEQSPERVLRCIYDQLLGFIDRHQVLFRDESAAASFAGSFTRYHTMLRSQLAQPLLRFCPDAFTSEFIAEALLTWTVAGKDFREISQVIMKILAN